MTVRVEVFRLTTDSAVLVKGMPAPPLSPLRRLVAVPGCTLLPGAPAGEPDPAEVCGLWVLAWLVILPLPPVVVSAITYIVKQPPQIPHHLRKIPDLQVGHCAWLSTLILGLAVGISNYKS